MAVDAWDEGYQQEALTKGLQWRRPFIAWSSSNRHVLVGP